MRPKSKVIAFAIGAVLVSAVTSSASAQVSGNTVKIGLLTDMSGVYSDISGQGGIEATSLHTNLSCLISADAGGEVHHAL